MVKEKESCSSCGVIERWHGFNPFGEIVNGHDTIFMVIIIWVEHSINLIGHLQKGPVVMTRWRGAGGAHALGEYN